MANKFHFDRVIANMEQVKMELPVRLAKQAENYFLGGWKKQGFDGEKWPEVQRRIPGTNAWKYPKNKGLSRRTKPIMVGTGDTRRKVSNSMRDATWERIRLIVDSGYAKFLNEGRFPFMFQTDELKKMQLGLINKTIDTIWRGK